MKPEDRKGPDPTIVLAAKPPIGDEGIEAAIHLMRSGSLHRYSEAGSESGPVSRLEERFATELGVRYCAALNSCGSALFAALYACGVQPGHQVLTNAFTLSPVPGAIVHAGAEPVLVDITDDFTIDLDDLQSKASSSGARTLLLSHMRGHVCNMERLSSIAEDLGLAVIEDCAHTMGAAWDGRLTGTWGQVGCFSLQSYKHVNAGEGGLLVTNDPDCAARAILLSGSYMFYGTHQARPDESVFERWRDRTPNCSLRLPNVAAAIALPQLGATLRQRMDAWNLRYGWLVDRLAKLPHIRLPERDPREAFVGSSLQFSLVGLDTSETAAVVERCHARGLPLKWFGAETPKGYTSNWRHWNFSSMKPVLPNAERLIPGLCDLRIPLTLTLEDADRIADILATALT